MTATLPSLDKLKANPDWANLPLLDRKGWSRVRFGEVVTQLKEKVDPVEDGVERYVAGEHMETENVHIRVWGNVGDGYLGPAFIRRFRKGQVLYGSRRTYLKKVAVAEWDGVTANTTFVLEANPDKLLPELLPWLMLSDRFTQHSVAESKGSTNPYINFPDIAKFEFDLPPLEQQRRLADILWAIDQTAVQWAKVAERAERALESMRKEHFETSIERGKSVLLSDVGKWKSGNTPSRSRSDYWKGELPWVSPKDMKVVQIMDTEEHLTEAGWEQSSTVPQGSLLIVIRGMILAHSFPVAIAGREVAFNQDMKALRVYGDYSNEYMFNWFQWAKSSLLRNISESSHGTKRLTTDVLFSQRVPKIGRREQDVFVQSALKADSVAADAQSHIFCSREFLKAFLNTVFS